MFCDLCGVRDTQVFVIKPRPSDPSELVCILGYCMHCTEQAAMKTVQGVALSLAIHDNVASTKDVLEEYMESSYSSFNKHYFLTL